MGRVPETREPTSTEPVGEQVEEAPEVAPLGPAHVTRGVVDALELVAVVVAARAVGAREPDVELLLVVGVPRQVEPGLADVDDARTVPREPRGELDWAVAVPAGGEEDVVGAEAAGRRMRSPARCTPPPRRRARHRPLPRLPPPCGSARAQCRRRRRAPRTATSSRTTSCPISPRPMTHAVSPSCTSPRRTPCMAMAPTVAKAACCGTTPGNRHAQVGRHPVQLGVEGELVAGRRHDVARRRTPRHRHRPRRRRRTGSSRAGCSCRACSWPSCRWRPGPAGRPSRAPSCTWSGRARALPSSESRASRHLHQLGAGRDQRVESSAPARPRACRPAGARRARRAHQTGSSGPPASCDFTLRLLPLHRPRLLATRPRHRQRGRSGTRARGSAAATPASPRRGARLRWSSTSRWSGSRRRKPVPRAARRSKRRRRAPAGRWTPRPAAAHRSSPWDGR